MEKVPCEQNDACKYYPNCYEDTHHLLYPSADYTTPLERLYRSLDDNKVEMCRQQHDELHRTQQPPEKPTREEMLHEIGSAMIYISTTKRKQIYGEQHD